MYGYIYKTTNKINGKIYVGQHMGNNFDPEYYGSGKYLNNAIRKYGVNNFTVEILEFCETKDSLNQREIFWIHELQSQNNDIGYNISFGGDGGDTFTYQSEEDKELIRQKSGMSTKGKIGIHKDGKRKYIDRDQLQIWLDDGWQKGSPPPSDETRKRLRKKHLGVVYVTNGISNKRVKPEELTLWEEQGYYRGFTSTQKMKDSHKNRSRTAQEKKNAELAKWYATDHYCLTCGKLLTEFIGSGKYCSKSCSVTHKHTDETKELLRKYVEQGITGNKGKTFSEETKRKMSAKAGKAISGKIAVNDGETTLMITPEELAEYLNNGYSKGRKKVPGRKAWNSGLTKNDPRVADCLARRNASMLDKYGTLNVYKIKKMKEDLEVSKNGKLECSLQASNP